MLAHPLTDSKDELVDAIDEKRARHKNRTDWPQNDHDLAEHFSPVAVFVILDYLEKIVAKTQSIVAHVVENTAEEVADEAEDEKGIDGEVKHGKFP